MASVPNTPAIPSADVAAANWDKSAPPAADPAGTPPATPPATPAPAAAQPDSTSPVPPKADAPATPDVTDDLSALLKDDLTPVPPPPGEPQADPLEALKDNPRVQELVKAEETVKSLLTKSEYIKEAAHIENAIADADVLWKIIDGKEHPKAILEALKATSPQVFPQVLQQLREYIEQQTGQPIAAAAAGQPPVAQTPEQIKLAAIEKELNDRKQADATAVFNKRVEAAQTTVIAKLDDMLKGTWLEGESKDVLNAIGAKLAQKVGFQKATEQMIEAVEKNNFTLLEKTLREIRNEEATRLDARIKRLIDLKKKKAATIPVQVPGGTPVSNEPAAQVAITDDEKRKEAMLKAYRGQ